jgi:predicted lipoprotein with Yx(FWY)xxD motif
MKRTYILLAAVLASALGATAVAGAGDASGAAPSARAAGVKVELRHTRLGSILTTSRGLTVYEFTRDHTGEDSCMKIHDCAKAWPPLLTSGKPLAGPGVSASLLSSIRLPDGAEQATYAGHALYGYIGDSPGSTGYVGVNAFGGLWYALSASGNAVK